MNAGCYAVAYNLAMEKFWQQMALGENQVKAGRNAPFVLECHLTYKKELKVGDPLLITAQLLEYDKKKARVFLRMFNEEKGFLASTYEQITVCVDLETRRSTMMPDEAIDKLEHLFRDHQDLPMPPEAGSTVGMSRQNRK
jgi:acyl-CoA thioester hydrolase